jgi:hypothetical protein
MDPQAVDQFTNQWLKHATGKFVHLPAGFTKSVIESDIGSKTTPVALNALKSTPQWKLIMQASENWNQFLKLLASSERVLYWKLLM